MRVGDEVVDAFQSRRMEVADPGCLDRGRSSGKYGKVVISGMPRKIDQDVDMVGMDSLRELIIAQQQRITSHASS